MTSPTADPPKRMVTLRSNEETPTDFKVDIELLKHSSVVQTMMDSVGIDEDTDLSKEEYRIPIPKLDSATLKAVIKWLEKHRDDPVQEEKEDKDFWKEKRTDDIPEWDQDFLKGDQKRLFSLLAAANFLDIKGLMDACCKTTARMINECSTAEEVRAKFNIVNDLSPQQEEAIRKANAWSDEC